MLTLENAKLFLEHAPPARRPHVGDILGWRITADLNTICDDCASRIVGRGCDFTGVVPIYRTGRVLAIACDACGQKLGDVGQGGAR